MSIKSYVGLLLVITVFSSHAITLSIPSYPVESIIPDDYTYNSGGNCSGANVSPQLLWSDVPEGTESLAIVFVDLNFNWLHWMLYNIDANVTHIPENNPNNVGINGQSSFGFDGYGGPCPPSPNPGNYVFTIHALNTVFQSEPSRAAINAATIDSASYLAYRDVNDSQERYEYIAQYKLTFYAEWSNKSHPEDYPSGAHFSPLVGTTHNNASSIWVDGGFSSNGMEQMAESGSTSLIRNDIIENMNSSSAESSITGSGIDAVDMTEVFFEISESHPLFTMVTMIAPSPDWFLGVHDLDLRDETGLWRDNFSVDLFAYDAGTDSGKNYTSPNSNTNPQDPIFQITTGPFANNTRLGRFEFELLSSAGMPTPDDIFSNGFE